ncbi:MAG: aminopeptidase [Bacteroidetes bacterium MedPE-SWsnd-G2]|nr:MAG: aminopeptidase [Bacteroidetes bacterium MedPE-SWsnd-G2]
MKNILLKTLVLAISFTGFSQSYQFTTQIDLDATNVISQGRTGTCWSFSASSFLESEIIRLTGKQIDISEMYNVRHTYPKKAQNYVMRQGKAQFSEGGLAHDVMNSVADFGLVPNSVYNGLNGEASSHDHAEMINVLTSMMESYAKQRKLSKNWEAAVASVLDVYLGKPVKTFNYEGKNYTPKSFMEYASIKPENYVSITSFNHQPFYSNFVLNIPDNFSNGSFYNVPINELEDIVIHALENGYTVELDCDVSEKTFSAKNGVAVIPNNSEDNSIALNEVKPEKEITQDYRQQEFENFNTTDDHLMHITGLLKDQNGTIYYKVKNSWGTNPERVANGGYVYMSSAYFKLKTISVLLHKDAIKSAVVKKLNL